jgi:uncharacterized protein (TIGR03435 family)
MRYALPWLLFGALEWAQSPTFEAAAIKVSEAGRRGGGLRIDPARIKVINSSLKFCVQVAWNVKDFQVAGASGWMDSDHYDIDAVAAKPFSREELRVMLQALLQDRFGLVVHTETQEKGGYALVVAKNGPKLPAPQDDPSVMFSRTANGDRTLAAKSLTMKGFADALTSALGGVVVDQTGIEGKYDVSFQWTRDPASEMATLKSGEPAPPPPDAIPGPGIFTVLQNKLGLKLESRKVPMEVIVIERASRPTEN